MDKKKAKKIINDKLVANGVPQEYIDKQIIIIT